MVKTILIFSAFQLGTRLYLRFMIQRIQTLYLLLSILFSAAYLYAPVIMHDFGKSTESQRAWEVIWYISGYLVYFNLIFISTASALSLIAIFLYRNRPVQSILCLMPIPFLLASFLLNFYKFWFIESVYDKVLLPGNLLLLLPLVCLFLAWNAIRKDEQLIKSLDRLR
jgi:hypothetical protein